jgi:hypothetical protein
MEHQCRMECDILRAKSVSLTALVGRDERVREAHRESVAVALDELGSDTYKRVLAVIGPPKRQGNGLSRRSNTTARGR